MARPQAARHGHGRLALFVVAMIRASGTAALARRSLRRPGLRRALGVSGGSDGHWHINMKGRRDESDAGPEAAAGDALTPDWVELMAYARCASLVYYEAAVIARRGVRPVGSFGRARLPTDGRVFRPGSMPCA